MIILDLQSTFLAETPPYGAPETAETLFWKSRLKHCPETDPETVLKHCPKTILKHCHETDPETDGAVVMKQP